MYCKQTHSTHKLPTPSPNHTTPFVNDDLTVASPSIQEPLAGGRPNEPTVILGEVRDTQQGAVKFHVSSGLPSFHMGDLGPVLDIVTPYCSRIPVRLVFLLVYYEVS